MNLVIDWGNTSIKAAWFTGGKLAAVHRGLSLDELTHHYRQHPAGAVLVSSTSRPGQELRTQLGLEPDVYFLALDGMTPVPIEKQYDTPHTLGTDRVAAAVGAATLFPGEPCLVVDMGTCITYDYVHYAGELAIFAGGMISPGFHMRFRAMHAFTERLPLVEPTETDPPLLARNTRQAMEAGVVNGLLGELDGIIDAHRRRSPAVRVVLCGGDAPFFESRLKPPIFAAPDVVLIGLNRILEYNLRNVNFS